MEWELAARGIISQNKKRTKSVLTRDQPYYFVSASLI